VVPSNLPFRLAIRKVMPDCAVRIHRPNLGSTMTNKLMSLGKGWDSWRRTKKSDLAFSNFMDIHIEFIYI
jgi:hypothetical protein